MRAWPFLAAGLALLFVTYAAAKPASEPHKPAPIRLQSRPVVGRVADMTLAQYIAAFRKVRKRVAAASDAVANGGDFNGEMPGAVANRLLKKVHRVESPDGSVIVVRNKQLLYDIGAADSASTAGDQSDQYAALLGRLDYQIGEMSAEEKRVVARGAASARPPGDYLKLSRSILTEPDYASDPYPPPPPYEQWAVRFDKWLNGLFNRPTWGPNINAPSISPKVFWVILGLFCATLFGILVWMIYTAIARSPGRVATIKLSGTEEALVEARDTESILSLADRHARAGEYRAGFRLVYLATLVTLDTAGILRFDRSKTNWEYLRALRANGRHDLYQSLAPLTRDFDRVWYGLSGGGPDEYRRAVDEYRKLADAAGVQVTPGAVAAMAPRR